jgi:membrane fusion protein, heavy metal efflux system
MNRIIFCVLILALAACARTPEESSEKTSAPEQKEKGTLEMSEKAQAHVGLKVVSAEVRPLTEYLQVTGTVQPIDSKVAHVRPIAPGRLLSVNAKIGDRVSTGDVLATFDNTDASELASQLQVGRSELDKLNIQLSIARQQSERNRQLAEIGAIPRKEYDLSLSDERSISASIDTQQKVLLGLQTKLQRFGFGEDAVSSGMTASVRAPFAGVVIHADASPGGLTRPEEELFQIADASQVWVQAEVYEKDLGRVQSGQIAYITVDTYPDREFLGKVTYISDVLDAQTRTARVRCDVTNLEGLLKLDMFATVRLPTKFRKEGMAVPVDALQQIEGKDVVFVRTGPTTFEQRVVRVGKLVQGLAEIISGLEVGDSVVTQGAFHLKSIALGDQIGEEE